MTIRWSMFGWAHYAGRRWMCAALSATALASCATVAPGPAPGYTNPVLERDFPDPAILRSPDGWLYAYATQTTNGDRPANIQVARSRNLVDWEYLGDALPRKPPWGSTKRNFWAPHVVYDSTASRYVMYYSAEPDVASGMCLAVAVAESPAGPFVDRGRPLRCGEEFESIDPMAFDDPQSGRHLLYWGSSFKPIRVQELAADRTDFLPGSEPIDVLAAGPDRSWGSLVEGAWVTYRQGTYFLFYSAGLCCGSNADYAVMVARSESPFGPFEPFSKDGKPAPILSGNSIWRAPGHNGVVTDDEGQDWILYHAMRASAPDPAVASGAPVPRVLLLDRIVYADAWPRINRGSPSTEAQPPPAFGAPR